VTLLFQSAPGTPVVRPRGNDGGRINLGQQISIIRPKGPRVGGHAAPQDRRGPIPEPVADSMLNDENPVIMSTAEKENLVGFAGGTGEGVGTEIGQGVPSGYEDPWPVRGDFVYVETPPELVYSVTPEYPRMAKEVGIEGTVVIQALVGKEGDVLDAVVFVSSGNTLLDAAALAVAWKYKYRPAIQNGRPLAIWVTYNVEFRLER
jgi:TonB family protein